MQKIKESLNDAFPDSYRLWLRNELITWAIIGGLGIVGVGLIWIGLQEQLPKIITIPSLVTGMVITAFDGAAALIHID